MGLPYIVTDEHYNCKVVPIILKLYQQAIISIDSSEYTALPFFRLRQG